MRRTLHRHGGRRAGVPAGGHELRRVSQRVGVARGRAAAGRSGVHVRLRAPTVLLVLRRGGRGRAPSPRRRHRVCGIDRNAADPASLDFLAFSTGRLHCGFGIAAFQERHGWSVRSAAKTGFWRQGERTLPAEILRPGVFQTSPGSRAFGGAEAAKLLPRTRFCSR